MTLSKVKEILKADVYACEGMLERTVESGCGSDLMSDVLAFSKEKAIMLTGLVNPQVIRTAEMMDMKAVCFVRGKTPGADIIKLAEEKGVVVMSTKHLMYNACGLLSLNGLGNDSDTEEATEIADFADRGAELLNEA